MTYEKALTGLSDTAIDEAALRFIRGEVPKQSKTFAPSIAEFVDAVRKQEEFIDLRNRPRLPAPKYIPGKLAPYQVRMQKAFAENSHLPVLFEDISFDQWKRMSEQKQVPAGAKWVACLSTVFGPPKQQSQAA